MPKRRMLWLDGIEEVLAELKEIGDRAEGAVEKALDEAGKLVQEDASQRAPRKTGFLASEIVREVDVDKLDVRIGPSKAAWYGKFPELGTKHQAAQPFLRPALDARRKDAREAFITELEKAIEAALR